MQDAAQLRCGPAANGWLTMLQPASSVHLQAEMCRQRRPSTHLAILNDSLQLVQHRLAHEHLLSVHHVKGSKAQLECLPLTPLQWEQQCRTQSDGKFRELT